MLQLMDELINRLPSDELELFPIQAWFIWHQWNIVIHSEQLQGLGVLNKRARDFMEEFWRANNQLSINSNMADPTSWCPPPLSRFKLNFDATIFMDQVTSRIGAIIQNY